MSVTYNLDVSTSDSFSFVRLLFRWRGSVWRSIYKELFFWLVLYYLIFVLYRYILDEHAQKIFGRISVGCDKELSYIPLTFLLGFFVTQVINRWRQIFANMGFIENSALSIASILKGKDEESILIRRSIVRYMVLGQILVFRNTSMKVRRRFPSLESVIRAGFMTPEEKRMLDDVDTAYNKYWVPISWAMSMVARKVDADKIAVALHNNLMAEIKQFRTQLATVANHDWVPIPLAYPQVVFLAVRMYFLVCTVSRQFLIDDEQSYTAMGVDIYFPVMTVFQFIFLVGWMKVAEALLNPLGEDDDDFECNFLIDKNLMTGLSIVDAAFDVCPEPCKDKFLDSNFFRPQKGALIKGSAATVKLRDSEGNLCVQDDDEPRTRSRTERLRERIDTIFSIDRAKEFDRHGHYNTRYFSQMSRY